MQCLYRVLFILSQVSFECGQWVNVDGVRGTFITRNLLGDRAVD